MKLSKLINQRGFTMIELLVVIAVIGVLAVAVLSSINPIEQVNKGRDTRMRSDAAQLLNAIDRYYAIQEVYPWNDVIAGTSVPRDEFDCPDGELEDCTGAGSWVQRLVITAEVKESFLTRIAESDEIYVFKSGDIAGGALGDIATVYACFQPSSRQFQLEAARKCQDGLTPDLGADDHFCNGDRTSLEADPDKYICLP